MKNEWHIPHSEWRVVYSTINKGVFLVLDVDGDTIIVSTRSQNIEIPLFGIPKNRLHTGQWSMLMHLLQLAIGGDYEHD